MPASPGTNFAQRHLLTLKCSFLLSGVHSTSTLAQGRLCLYSCCASWVYHPAKGTAREEDGCSMSRDGRGQQGRLPSGKSLPSSTGTAPSIWQSCFIPDSQKWKHWMFPPRRKKSSHLLHVSGRGESMLCCLSWHIKHTISLLFLKSCHNPEPYNMFRSLFQTIKASALNPTTPTFPSVQRAHKSSICLEDFPHQWVTCSTDSGQDVLVRDDVHPENTSFFLRTGTTFCVFLYCRVLGHLLMTELCLRSRVLELAGMSAQTIPCLHSHTGTTPSRINLLSCHPSGPQSHRQRLLAVPVMCQGQSSDAGRRNQGCSCPVLYLLLEWANNSTPLACCSEVFLKHQIHTEKINNSPVITHPIAISNPFIYYTPSKRYRARKQIKAWALAHHKL